MPEGVKSEQCLETETVLEIYRVQSQLVIEEM